MRAILRSTWAVRRTPAWVAECIRKRVQVDLLCLLIVVMRRGHEASNVWALASTGGLGGKAYCEGLVCECLWGWCCTRCEVEGFLRWSLLVSFGGLCNRD